MFVLARFDNECGLDCIGKFYTHKGAYGEILHDIEHMYDCHIDMDGYPFPDKGAGKMVVPDNESCCDEIYLYKDRVNIYTTYGYADYLIIEV